MQPVRILLIYIITLSETKSVIYRSSTPCDLFDIVAKEYVAKDVSGEGGISIPAKSARVIVILPAGTKLNVVDNQIIANKQHIISYQ